MSNKHDANVQKSSLLNFQIGLIASLLCIYILLEIPIQRPFPPIVEDPDPLTEPSYVWDGKFKEHRMSPKVAVVRKKKHKPVVDPDEYKQVPDDTELVGIKNAVINLLPNEPTSFDPNSLEPVDTDPPVEKVIFIAVEEVPIFPGCEGLDSNEERAACFSERIQKHVSKKFNSGLGQRYGLKGRQKIDVQFEVGKDGFIQNIRVRAPHKALEKEAIRVTKSFPKMIPGKQRGEPVAVEYQLPIIFQIQD